ncbi:hypothetical protein CLF_105226 [Clonorchis sinensis]|uniref:Uncharacterized protein n=1 Tax=Clonorchis sinensis TaxID=79923 RepID=H2KR20_CLOSI|nr:hypothetical protein CLF_105226 [Clonorchis sinensis]
MEPLSTTTSTDSMYQLRLVTVAPESNTGTATCSFQQRQSSVFDALADLEAAHKRVTEATKEERRELSRTTWRHVVTAPEDLVAEKERRKADSPHGDRKQPRQVFRRPNAPPPLSRRPQSRTYNPKRWDPSKWTHYSLADVDEDGSVANASGDPNFAIASAFLAELRDRNADQEIDELPNDPRNHRILFRPTRGTKRRRCEDDKDVSSSGPTPIAEQECKDEDSVTSDVDGLDPAASPQTSSNAVFFQRRRQRQLRSRTPENPDSPPGSGDVQLLTEESSSSHQSSSSEEDIEHDDVMDHHLA